MTMSQAPVASRWNVPLCVAADWKRETDSIRMLPAVHRCYEGGPHRDFRLAVARVAADEAVHRLLRREVFLDGGYRGGLVGRLLVWERGLERVHAVTFNIICESRHEFAPRLRLEERGCEVGDRLLCVGLVFRPAFAVEPMQSNRLALYADIAREKVGMSGWHMELCAVGILYREDLGALAVHEDF